MNAKLEATQDEVVDNRIIVCAMADEFWTRHIIEQCVNDGNTALDSSVDSSEISVEGSYRGVTFESNLYDEDELYIIKMSIVNGDFWRSDTATSAEVQANILADSGYSYPEIEEALALVDLSEAQDGIFPSIWASSEEEEEEERN